MSLINTSINLLKSLIQPQNLAANEISSLLESIHGSLLAMQRREAELLAGQAVAVLEASPQSATQETDTLSLMNGTTTKPSSITLNETVTAKPDTDTTKLASGSSAIGQPEKQAPTAKPDADTTELASEPSTIGLPENQDTSAKPKTKQAFEPTPPHSTDVSETSSSKQLAKPLDNAVEPALVNALRALMTQNKLTQTTLAAKLGISRQHISGILRLHDKPSPELAIRIKALLKSEHKLSKQSIKPSDDAEKSALVEELRAWLRQNKLTQVSVANRLGIGEMHMSNILRLKIKPSADLATRIRDLIDGDLPTSTTSQP